MARPNNPAAIASHVRGLKEAKAAFQALPDIVRERLLEATETTVREIQRVARARLQASPSIQTRNLYNHVQWTLNRKNGRGRVGIASGSSVINVRPGIRLNQRVKGIVIPGKGGSALTSQGARMDRPSRRAHFIEFGTRKMHAEPFMIPAAESEKQPHLRRCVAAGPQIERDVAKIGLRNA